MISNNNGDGPKRYAKRVSEVVQVLREKALKQLEGDPFLGSEESLLIELGTSIPTLRQAVRILQHEQLITTKPGKGGGYFATLPDEEAVVQMSRVYLQARGVTIIMLAEVVSPMVEQACIGLCKNTVKSLRRQPIDFLNNKIQDQYWLEPEQGTRTIAEFYDLIIHLSENPVAELMIRTLVTLTRHHDVLFTLSPEHILSLRPNMLPLAQAIYDGDEDITKILVKRQCETVLSYMQSLP